MRILHVTPYFEHAWGYGGIPRAVAALVQGQRRLGHQVTVWTTDAGDRDARAPRAFHTAEGAQVEVFPNLSNAAAYRAQLFLPRGLWSWARRRAGGFELAHLHGAHHLLGLIARPFLERAHIPYGLSPHGTYPMGERRRWAKRGLWHLGGRQLHERARFWGAVSEVERSQLLALGVGAERIGVVPNALELPPPVPALSFTASASPRLLFMGRPSRQKGLHLLLEALRHPALAHLRLLVAGGGPPEGGGGNVEWLGLLRGPARWRALQRADLVVYPSTQEAFGLVPVEALACGTPVVVSRCSGVAPLVERAGGGVLVDAGAPGALRAGLLRALAELPALSLAAHQAAARVRAWLAPEVIADRMDALYQRALFGSLREAA